MLSAHNSNFGAASLLAYLAKSELQRRNAGTAGGMVYVFAGPLLLVLVMWAALDYGLGLRALVGPEFGLRLIIGMVLWLAITDMIGDAVSSIVRNPHLVKKMVFPVHFMPVASVLAGLAVHLVIVALAVAILGIGGQLVLTPWSLPILLAGLLLQLVFVLGLALATSAVNVVVRDAQSIVPMALSIGFWVTPIIWNINVVPAAWRWLVAVNPVAVGVEAYRTALLGTPWPFGIIDIIVAAGVAAVVLAIGIALIRLLRPSMADVL